MKHAILNDLELKNIEYSAALSEETHAYSATMYWKGKRVAVVKNSGHGGCDEYSPIGNNQTFYKNTLPAIKEAYQQYLIANGSDSDKAAFIRSCMHAGARHGDAGCPDSFSVVQQTSDADCLADFAWCLEHYRADSYEGDAEYLCCEIINDWHAERDMKKTLRTKVVFLPNGTGTGGYSWHPKQNKSAGLKTLPKAEREALLATRYKLIINTIRKATPDALIINELPEADRLAVWKAM